VIELVPLDVFAGYGDDCVSQIGDRALAAVIQIRTAKTFVLPAQDLCVARSFGKTAQTRALPTLGGNNGQAGAIHGQIVGLAETTIPDPDARLTRLLPVSWKKGKAELLPSLGDDPDEVTYSINDQDQAFGYSGTCTAAIQAVFSAISSEFGHTTGSQSRSALQGVSWHRCYFRLIF
jgi:hypothetical protein